MKKGPKKIVHLAENISSDELLPQIEEEIFIDLEELKRGFMASGRHLYSFIMEYNYPREVSYEEKITFFCQMVSIYEQELRIQENYQQDVIVEYAMVQSN